MSFVPEHEARTFDTEVIGFWSQLIKRDATSTLFHLPLELGGVGVGSAVQRHAAAPWRAWQSFLPTFMSATQSHATSPISRDILISQSAPHTGAHFLQPNSEAYEAEDRCFRVSMDRRLMLPHPAAPDPSGVAPICTNKSATGQTCGKPVDAQQHHCYGCRYGGGVDRKRAAVARCLADVIHTHSGT